MNLAFWGKKVGIIVFCRKSRKRPKSKKRNTCKPVLTVKILVRLGSFVGLTMHWLELNAEVNEI